MGIFGKILSLPIKAANVPLRTMEKMVDPDQDADDAQREGAPSGILKSLSDAIEEIDE